MYGHVSCIVNSSVVQSVQSNKSCLLSVESSLCIAVSRLILVIGACLNNKINDKTSFEQGHELGSWDSECAATHVKVGINPGLY